MAPKQQGFMLATVMVLIALLMVLIAGFASLASIEMATTRSDMRSFQGFYAAEAGLNARADSFRQLFLYAGLPSGTAPTSGGSSVPCTGTNQGSGNFACGGYSFQGRNVQTWVSESSLSTDAIVIPRGEVFNNLYGYEYHYVVFSEARNTDNAREASLEMHFKSRTVPLFQFAAFYGKDLEVLPGPGMTLEGPVHTNRDMYLGTDNTLDILGQVTAMGDIYRGRKDAGGCPTGTVNVLNPSTLAALPACSGSRKNLTDAELAPWNGNVDRRVPEVTIPPPGITNPSPSAAYFAKADLRIMLDLNPSTPVIQVLDADGAVNATLTSTLTTCGSAGRSSTLYNNREGSFAQTLDVDVRDLLDCIHSNALLGSKTLTDATEGGLVIYLGVDGPSATGTNNYGVRLKNGATLASTVSGAPAIQGLTVVSNQAAYVQGDYNSASKKPAAVLADTINILSNNWLDSKSNQVLDNRVASNTTINAAFLAGTDSTGGVEGTGGQGGAYNGGLENYPRLHEKWDGKTFTYSGSFVSLSTPQHAVGAWVYGGARYTAPTRAWSFDTDFEDPDLLPPMTPMLVYLKQELFVRRFEL
jgi:hypothetical protein